MINVLSVFGTRPEGIKMAPVVRELARRPGEFEVHTCATAQHRELLDQVLALFDIVPDVDLDLMEESQTPSQVASKVLARLPPVDYLTLVQLMKRSTLVLTDSGGIQEEAPALGVPVLVLREKTERPEAVEAGVARVVGTETERIVGEVFRLLEDEEAYAAMARGGSPYGDGRAAGRIVEALVEMG
jgi:UDP-N-acetylglucosamine 2-epimerase (non-hydrolysing)